MPVNEHLRRHRAKRNLRQQEVADAVGAALSTVQRWERGVQPPTAYYRAKLCQFFGVSAQELGLLEESSPSAPPESEATDAEQPENPLPAEKAQEWLQREQPWNVPFARNPFFTGRSQLLERLHEHLGQRKSAALTQSAALSGLGGIGKTQTAIEYAYRWREEYRAVFWVRGGSRETLITDYVAIAQLLCLPGYDTEEQMQVVATIKRWLQEQQDWLLILDNADDLALLSDFLPREGKGHLLLTTRAQATRKIARSLAVEKMELSEGTQFVLRRAKLLEEDEVWETVATTTRTAAQQLVEELDGLPLALDQAGAYIEETGCSISQYLTLYSQRSLTLLKRKSSMADDYPHTVASTWTLSFSNVERADLAAADLLRVCAFLHPDAIPEAILIEGAAALGPQLQAVATDPFLLNEAIQLLRRYSLVKRDAEAQQLNVHRLVQVVLRESLDEASRRLWAGRTVRAVNETFPGMPFAEWSQCERLLPHVLVCTTWIAQEQKPTLEASSLLDKAGTYLREQGQYAEAERLLGAAISIREQYLEAEDLLATSLSNLAGLYSYEAKYAEAEQLVERAYSIRERILGSEHPDTATSLSHLANLSTQQGKHAHAEMLYEQALRIYQQSLGTDHPTVAKAMGNLAVLYEDQGRYRQAEQLNRKVLSIYERHLEPAHPAIARTVSNLALTSSKLEKYEKAKALYERALSMQESEILDAAYSLAGLAEIACELREYEQAEKLYKQVLTIRERALKADHPDRAEALEGMAYVWRERQNWDVAEQLYRQALHIWEQQFGSESLQMTRSLTGLAHLARTRGKHAEAERLYRQALGIHEQGAKPQHPNTAETLDGLAQLWETQGNRDEAKNLYIRALTIREQTLGAKHSKTTGTRKRLISLLDAMGLQEEAAQLEASQTELEELEADPEE